MPKGAERFPYVEALGPSAYLCGSAFDTSAARSLVAITRPDLLQVSKQRRVHSFGRKRFGTAFAFFHNVLVEFGINRQGIIAGEARQAKLVFRLSGGAHHAFHIEVSETVHAEIFADVFN